MGDTLSVHQPYICIHQKYHLFPVKKVEVARFRMNNVALRRKIQTYVRSPSELFSDPTYFCTAIRTSDPITAPFFQEYHLTTWAIQSLASCNQAL